MLLFRGTDWHKGLSSETVQTVMNQWYDWFERLAEQGKASSGHPLAYEGKIVSGKKGHTVVDGPFVESKEAIGGYFLLHVENEEEARLPVWPSSTSRVDRRRYKKSCKKRPGL